MKRDPDSGAEKCVRIKKDGKRCDLWPMHGTTLCHKHGGRAGHIKRAATRNLTMARAQRMVELAGVDMDPIQHLLDSLHRAATLVQVWGIMLATLDDRAEGDRGDAQSDPLLYMTRLGEQRPHPFVAEYSQALERRAKFAKMCIDAGVAERQVRLAERMGEQLGMLFERTVGAIEGLSEAQRLQAASEFARVVGELERPALDGTARDAAA